MSLTEQAHRILDEWLKPGDVAIDATVGNGNDTAFLLRKLGPNGRVYGFDIQQEALNCTLERLSGTGLISTLTLIQASHADMSDHIPQEQHGRVVACMFNLGYRPGGIKSVTTQSTSTLAALNSAVGLLDGGGLITVLAYPGHADGEQEANQVGRWCESLNPALYDFKLYLSKVANTHAPRLYVIKNIQTIGPGRFIC